MHNPLLNWNDKWSNERKFYRTFWNGSRFWLASFSLGVLLGNTIYVDKGFRCCNLTSFCSFSLFCCLYVTSLETKSTSEKIALLKWQMPFALNYKSCWVSWLSCGLLLWHLSYCSAVPSRMFSSIYHCKFVKHYWLCCRELHFVFYIQQFTDSINVSFVLLRL